ncbi:PH and SEC7 domain-containing protein-like isoform X2 [Aphidius gifuensis]|uniref:PH and SEC7 domain-containing protein-like isoform X2 n=1 Tax=Aphidius gifuensis TaxID=684658 RepID=UPI001CDBA32D|nr:PH and SEC7 domain-containing protein-like isoform X2 [Aphidius gifuensis]
MAEELLVTLTRRSDTTGFGFSLLGTDGLPHVIYDIVENSPAAECEKVEAGDVILKINDVDVNRLSTKEVLRRLRLSSDPVTLKLKKDPAIKAHVQRLLAPGNSTSNCQQIGDNNEINNYDDRNNKKLNDNNITDDINKYKKKKSNGSYTTDASGSSEFDTLLPSVDSFKEEEREQWEPLSGDKFPRPKNTPRFEAYMMTGDLMLNLSRTQQSTGFLPKYQKKVDSLRYNNHYTNRHNNSNNNNNNYNNNNNNNNNNHNHNHNHRHHHNSVPTSPNEMLNNRGYKNTVLSGCSNSANTSPVGGIKHDNITTNINDKNINIKNFGYSSNFVRTSRSEDHLQFQKDPSMSTVDIDIDDDVTSSLNTLLDTRPDSSQGISSERIVWTYNAPVTSTSLQINERTSYCHNGSSSQSTSSTSSIEETSPHNSLSPASPTSVSSSVMSSNSGSRRYTLSTNGHTQTNQYNDNNNKQQYQQQQQQQQNNSNNNSTTIGNNLINCHSINNGDCSQSEAISNMSSPDYNDEETMDILSSRDIMMVSDPSDSDSTILASEPPQRKIKKKTSYSPDGSGEHKIVIQVKGPDKENCAAARNSNSPRGHRRRSFGEQRSGSFELKEYEDEKELVNVASYDEQKQQTGQSPPQSADEESDIESLHSFHYSPKAVDLPSAVRLAKRLYSLDGFKKSDVSRHLSKNNDFSRAVAEEYLRYFNFERDTLDVALRKFLAQFSLTGETQERERVLVHFSKRYIDCNPGSFNSQDAVHTLTCAIMLLNTDLHGQNIGRKMSCSEFIENLSELNDGDNFPRDVLKQLYTAIKSYPLEWALDDEGDETGSQINNPGDGPALVETCNPFLHVPNASGATEFKKGYVMRKCCYDSNGKKTPFGKRSWKMYYCTLRELVLYLHKDEHGFRNDSLHNAIRIHHALATKASDYTKKQHVFRLQTADQAEYLFQTSDSKELQSWIDTINFVCASFSCQPLAGAVGSQRKFQRPLLPCSHTKFSPREQLRDQEEKVTRLEAELDEHRRHPPERGAKSLTIQNYKEKDVYLQYELKRYKTYSYLLRSRLAFTEIEPSLVESSIGEVDESSGGVVGGVLNSDVGVVPPPVPDRPASNRDEATTT